MQRDAERVDRVTLALGPELFAKLVEEWTAIGYGKELEQSCLADVASACRRKDVSPEAMLVAVRVLSRSFFERGSREADRVEAAWLGAVRTMMNAFFAETKSA